MNKQRVSIVGELVSLQAAAEVLGVSYYQVRYYLKTHAVPVVQVGRSSLVRLPDLAGLLGRGKPKEVAE